MFMKKWVIGWVFLLTIAVAAISAHNVSAESDVVSQSLETAKAIEVDLNDDNFNPKVITIPNGKTTMLTLKNKGVKEHTFTVEKLGIDVDLKPGTVKSITVKPQQPGTYELICRFHFREGMVGQIIVN
jgi:plastocyanin